MGLYLASKVNSILRIVSNLKNIFHSLTGKLRPDELAENRNCEKESAK